MAHVLNSPFLLFMCTRFCNQLVPYIGLFSFDLRFSLYKTSELSQYEVYVRMQWLSLIQNGEAFRDYVAESTNNTWEHRGDDIFLTNTNTTLVNGVLGVSIEQLSTCVF